MSIFPSPLVAGVFLLGLSVSPSVYGQDEPPPNLAEVTATITATLKSQLSGQIRVGGAVLDAATGKPLAGVRFSVRMGTFDLHLPGLRSITTFREEVTGAFRYQCDPCTDTRIRWSKDGYRSETLSFAVAAVEGNVVDETHLRIALRPLQNPVVLQAIQGELIAGVDHEAKVLALGSGTRKARIVGLERLPAKAADGTVPFVLRLTSEQSDDGRALVVKISEEKAQYAPVVPVHPRPVGAALDFSSVGGVIRHLPTDPRPLAALRSMLEAPTDGYSESLELGTVTERVFFYCKVGERHGKGYVEAPWVDGKGIVRAQVRLWLNDGGRSVEEAYE